MSEVRACWPNELCSGRRIYGRDNANLHCWNHHLLPLHHNEGSDDDDDYDVVDNIEYDFFE